MLNVKVFSKCKNIPKALVPQGFTTSFFTFQTSHAWSQSLPSFLKCTWAEWQSKTGTQHEKNSLKKIDFTLNLPNLTKSVVLQIRYCSHDWRFSNHRRHRSGMSRHVNGGYFRADFLHLDFIRGLPKVAQPSGTMFNLNRAHLSNSRGNRAETKRSNAHHTHTQQFIWSKCTGWIA